MSDTQIATSIYLSSERYSDRPPNEELHTELGRAAQDIKAGRPPDLDPRVVATLEFQARILRRFPSLPVWTYMIRNFAAPAVLFIAGLVLLSWLIRLM